MKKIYSLIALLAMMFVAVGASAQNYSLDSQVELPEPGVKYALYNVSLMTYAGSTSAGCTQQIVDDTNLWEFEKTGNTIDGYDLYRIKNVGKNSYWQEIDYENKLGLDGYDVFNYAGCNGEFGAAATAMEVTIAVADGASDRTTASGTGGVVIVRKNSVPQDENTTWWYRLECQGNNVAFSPWNENSLWQLWTVRENSNKDKLQILVDRIVEEDKQFPVSTDPGFFTQQVVDEYNSIFDAAQTALTQNKTEEEYGVIFQQLTEAYNGIDAKSNPIKAGYYYIVSAFPEYMNQQEVEKAVFGKDATTPNWGDFKADDYSFLWKFEANGTGWKVKNVLYEAYLAGAANTGASLPISMAPSTNRVITFATLGSGQWKFFDNVNPLAYHTNGHSGGAGKGSNLVTWDGVANTASAWYIRTVTDQEYINNAIKAHAQVGIKTELNALITEAGTLYDALFVTSADLDNPLVTEADDSKTPGQEGNQFLCNRQESSEGRYGALIDGITSTEDGGNKYANDEWAYFHSSWSGGLAFENGHSGDDKDFMQVDISKTPVSSFVLRTARRYNNPNAQPVQISIYVTNDTTGYYNKTDAWTYVSTIYPKTCNQNEFYTSPLIDLGKNYKYVRFVVDKTNNDVRYFTYSEFQLYPGSISEELSQYYYAAGMKKAADAMKASAATASAAVEAGNATNAMVTDLKAKIAAVRALYADPAELTSLITKAEAELQYATVGAEMGNIASQDIVDAYTTALADAQGFDLQGALDKTALDNVTNTLASARKAFLDNMVAPVEGKWYYISSTDQTREGDSYTHGASIFAEKVGVGSAVRWGANESGELAGQALAIWRVVPVKDAATPHTVYIQNMGTGLYLGGESVNLSYVTKLSATPVAFTITYVGNSDLAICATEKNTNNTSLHAQVAGKSVVGWYYNMGGVDKDGNPSNTASLWTFNEVNPEEVEGITIPVVAGTTNIKTLPFAVSGISEVNEGFKAYAIQDITDANGVSTVSLYMKDNFEAGEPFILEVPESEDSLVDLVAYLPEDVVSTPSSSNGLVGVFATTNVPVGNGYLGTDGWTAAAEGATVPAQTGYINPSKFTGAVAGVTVAKTIQIAGLAGSGLAGDVNGDGRIDATDVVTLYNYIANGTESGVSLEAADVNGDGKVDGADVVEVYNIASGSTAQSGAFGKEIVGASEIIPADRNDKAFLTISVGSTTDLAKIPVSVILTNPEVEITAVEGCMFSPAGVNSFLYDEQNEDFEYDASDRWTRSHGNTSFAGTKLHGFDWFFFSIVSNKSLNFKGNDGVIATFYFDGSSLADGKYEIKLKDAISVWTDKRNTKTYDAKPMSSTFTISGGKATGVEGVEAENGAKAGSAITVDGKAASSLQKGQIYIIDGKKVKF